jgi:GT2 family glycosyltransferase
MNDQYTIGIVIVTWNGKHHLEKLLPNLLQQEVDAIYKIVIVDNASSDGTREYLNGYGDIDTVFLSCNKGFAEPNNIGVHYLLEKYTSLEKIVFLNNDTMVSSNFLSVLLQGFDISEKIASVQTKIVPMYDYQIIDSVGILIDESMSAINKGQGEYDYGQYDRSGEIFGTTGSAMMISRKALEDIALGDGVYFDPLYFAYQEDVDLAWRLRLRGYISWYNYGGSVYHVHSATGKNYSAFKSFHIHRNTLFVMFKNMPLSLLAGTVTAFLGRYVNLVRSIVRKSGPSYEVSKKIGMFAMIRIVVVSWLSLVWYLPQLLRKRRLIQKKRRISPGEVGRLFKKFNADSKKMIYDTRS